MSFTSDIKKEIIARGIGQGEGGLMEKKAALSAFIRTSGFLGEKDGLPNFFIVSETENVAEFFMTIFSEIFNVELSITRATMDRMSGRDKLLLQAPQSMALEIMRELGLVKRTGGIRYGISARFKADEERMIAYVQGAFLGAGSCTVISFIKPSTIPSPALSIGTITTFFPAILGAFIGIRGVSISS